MSVLGGDANLFDLHDLFQIIGLFRLFSYLGDIFVSSPFLDLNGFHGWLHMFHVGSTTTDPVQFLGPRDQNKVLVDNVDDDALASGFSAVEFYADASDFYCWHSLTSRASPCADGIRHLRFRCNAWS